MRMRIVFLFCFACGSVSSASGQARTVTNTDLEKYRSERVKAEAYLRENYERLGFPSPEELARRNQQAAREMSELSARLRSERLERERIEAEREAAERRLTPIYQVQTVDIAPDLYGGTYFWSGRRRVRRPFFQPFQQPGYFAGGTFIPTGVPPKPGPAWRKSRP
jgi:hypothetical protein